MLSGPCSLVVLADCLVFVRAPLNGPCCEASPIPKECIFCQADFRNAERTREHTIAQWLIRELRIGDGELTSTHFDGRLAITSRSMAPRSFLAGRVCGTCNHGWMSGLEVAFAPIFRGLNSGTRTFAQLSRSERTIVARWTLKSLAALNWAAGYIHSIPPDHRHFLARDPNELPPNVFVFGTRWTRSWGVAAAQEDFVIASPSQWQLKEDKREVRLPRGGYYKIGIQVGSVLLAAFYWRTVFGMLRSRQTRINWFGRLDASPDPGLTAGTISVVSWMR
jgi:hypothetical protein